MARKAKLRLENVEYYFLQRAFAHEAEDMSPMKLQKLLYFAQGWHMALHSKHQPLFEADFEAWQQGPVIPSVWRKYRGLSLLLYQNFPGNWDNLLLPQTEDPELLEFLDLIWRIYGSKSTFELSELTYRTGTPWDLTRDDTGQNRVIPKSLMLEYFRHHAAEKAIAV